MDGIANSNSEKAPRWRKKPCRFMAQVGGCNKGSACTWSHEPDTPVETLILNSDEAENEGRIKRRLATWRSSLRREHYVSLPKEFQLGAIFKEALALSSISSSLLQEVIALIASENGLRCISDIGLVVQNVIEEGAAPSRKSSIAALTLSFFRIITNEYAKCSAVLEKSMSQIYYFLYGSTGSRGRTLFAFLRPCLEEISDWEVYLSALATMIDVNQDAILDKNLLALVIEIDSLMISTKKSSFKLDALILHIRRRMQIGQQLPEYDPVANSPAGKSAHFDIPLDFPGALSMQGPRHDNDHQDIASISIMPTWDELLSERSDYLPTTTSSHLRGMAAIVDRQFRLLRQDTVGPLRDALRPLLNPHSTDSASPSSSARTHVYHNVLFDEAGFDTRKGLQLHVSLDEPLLLGANLSRRDWWSNSKRLQYGALVCLVGADNLVLFCTVSTDVKQRNPVTILETSGLNQHASLDSAECGRVRLLLSMVEHDEALIRDLLSRFVRSEVYQLVEFHGVLLASFHATLVALQDVSRKIADFPFAEVLCETGSDWGVGQLPKYATHPNFALDLRYLVPDVYGLQITDTGSILDALATSTLDTSQSQALVHCLSRSFALIQGPPGTGKSFVGTAAVRILLDSRTYSESRTSPIICVCYTNHALDQLLENFVRAKVKNVVRIGSQSKSEILQSVNLREVAQNFPNTALEKRERYSLYQTMKQYEQAIGSMLEDLAVIQQNPAYALARFLHTRHADIADSIFPESGRVAEDGWQEVSSRSRSSPAQRLRRWIGNDPERQDQTHYWIRQMTDEVTTNLSDEYCKYVESKRDMDKISNELHLRCLQAADIIGLTTTGLARNIDLLRRVKAQTLVVEEAGEVIEAHMLTALLPSLEHVILIGDHQQLRPHINNFDLSVENARGKMYSFDVSLFERLVEQHSKSGKRSQVLATLTTQRRMHASISALIKPIYPNLLDGEIVERYPEVVGMAQRLFWCDHQELEDKSKENFSGSRTNAHELSMTIALASHLARQGHYSPADIAIITPYLGQLQQIRRLLRSVCNVVINDIDATDLAMVETSGDLTPDDTANLQNFKQVSLGSTIRLATVDNFQGEEAKVIIISLVRSNKEQNCGFVKSTNRINVLLSRAQHGMYILGNAATFESNYMWSTVLTTVKKGGNFGPYLPLRCPRHPDIVIEVSTADEFVRFSPAGGCDQKCGRRLACGHSCLSACHSDIAHKTFKCLQPCTRSRSTCEHPCKALCGNECGKCCEQVQKSIRLPCGHVRETLPCWEAQLEPGQISCYSMCTTILPCGHACKSACNGCLHRNPEAVASPCNAKCGRSYTTCSHACATTCHGEEDCPPCTNPCEVTCSHSTCQSKCSEPCSPCAQEICASRCPHSFCTMPCAAPCNWIPCAKRCSVILACGHQCPSLCGELCPSIEFCQICASDEIKDTVVDLLELRTYREIDLDSEPCLVLKCNHVLCVSSMDGHMEFYSHYQLISEDGETITSILDAAAPFSSTDVKRCPTCRASLQNVARYGRIVRRAQLDENTKRFIVWANKCYTTIAYDLNLQLDFLAQNEESFSQPEYQAIRPATVQLKGVPRTQIMALKFCNVRYKDIRVAREKAMALQGSVKKAQQPYNRVRTLVLSAARRQGTNLPFSFDESIIQFKYELLTTGLLLRCDMLLLHDFIDIDKRLRKETDELQIDLSSYRIRCLEWIKESEEAAKIRCETEGHIYFAHFCAIEKTAGGIFTEFALDEAESQLEREIVTSLALDQAKDHLERAKGLIDQHPNQTRGLSEELETVSTMLFQDDFQRVLTSAARKEILQAMATELRGTGHWYYCQAGHPFTIGECGMPMELASCPECGARIGGTSHQFVDGVTQATDLESELPAQH